MAKQYGLIIPNKNKANSISRPSIFNDDSDSDYESAKPTGLKTNIKRQDRLLQEKAIEEDPTIFQYDELYDDMDKKRKESKLSRKDLDRKPKYINKLLLAADRRKRENERRIERQVQKEREAEGEEFKGKESFVTSAYKKKLEELKELEEKEKREEYLEAIGDVKKQGNLDGFYRHLYDQKVNYEDEKPQHSSDDAQETKIKEEIVNSSDDLENPAESPSKKAKLGPKQRKYRKRESSDSEMENCEEKEIKMEHLPSNLDADSDYSIDSSSDEDEDIVKKEAKVPATETSTEVTEEKLLGDGKDGENLKRDIVQEVNVEEPDAETKEVAIPKPKIDIWKKRTVEAAFEDALKRYFERKALRDSGL